MSTTTVTSLDGFHATSTAQRADELVRAFFDAVNADDRARIDELVDRGFLSYDLHGTRSRTGLKRYYSDLRRSFSEGGGGCSRSGSELTSAGAADASCHARSLGLLCAGCTTA